MNWEDVFGKCFTISGRGAKEVLVFIPGTYTGNSIRYAWTTEKDIEHGVDITTLPSTACGLYGDEREKPSSTFNNWKLMKVLSREDRVCKKIKVMEERWKKFQEKKKAPESTLRGKISYSVTMDDAFFDSI